MGFHLYTTVVAVPCAFILLMLGGLITMRRMRGDAEPTHPSHDSFVRMTRVFGNNAEHTPLVVLLLLIFELAGGDPHFVFAVGAGYIVARCLHAVGLLARTHHPFHLIGASLTYTVELVCIVLLTIRFLST